MTLTLRPIAHSEIGLVRKTNQDSGYVSTSALIVADGMGGAAAGDLASGLAIRDLCHVNDTALEGQEALDTLKDLTFQANDDIARVIAASPKLDGMGTTICGGVFDGRDMTIAHIGDSRGYLLSDGVCTRLTHDHSYVQSLIDEGRLGEKEAMNHPHRSLLLKVLNGQPEIRPDFFAVELQAGDRIMFCSDGLCGLVDDAIIGTAMQLPNPADAMETLIELAHIAGGTDNITIILADVVEATGRESGFETIQNPDSRPATDMGTDEGTGAGDSDRVTTETVKMTVEMGTDGSDPDSMRLTTGLVGTAADSAIQEALPEPYVTSGLIGAAADPRIQAALDSLLEKTPSKRASAPAAHMKRLTSAELERHRYAPQTKKSHKGFVVIIATILVVLGGAGWGVYEYVSSQYFVGADNGRVAIYQGLPGTIAGIDTSKVYETTTVKLTDLPNSWRDKVTATIPTSGLDQARASVQEIRTKAQQCIADRANRSPGQAAQDGC